MGEREKLIEDAAIYAECSMADATQKYQSSAKQKAAYRAVRSAMESGALVRPASCEKCGKEPPPARDGRSKIHAHHHDYDKPLCVEWICALCHRKETPLHKHLPPALRGSKNPAAKLTAEDVLSIRELRAGGMPQYKIAALYGVERTCVRQICSGQTWGWLSASPYAKETGHE